MKVRITITMTKEFEVTEENYEDFDEDNDTFDIDYVRDIEREMFENDPEDYTQDYDATFKLEEVK